MVEIKTPGEIDAIRAAGRVVAEVLAAARSYAASGVTLSELDAAAREVLAKAGATSPFLHYKPKFAPAFVSTSRAAVSSSLSATPGAA